MTKFDAYMLVLFILGGLIVFALCVYEARKTRKLRRRTFGANGRSHL